MEKVLAPNPRVIAGEGNGGVICPKSIPAATALPGWA